MAQTALDRFTGWFRYWRLPLRRFLSERRAIAAADIEDVAQEVFLRVLRYGRSEFVENPQAYLFRIATNVAAEWSMRSSRRLPHDSNWLSDLAAESSLESEIDLDIEDDELARAVQGLTPRAREIIRLHYSDGLTHKVISERLNISHRIVKRDLIGAYTALRKALGHRL